MSSTNSIWSRWTLRGDRTKTKNSNKNSMPTPNPIKTNISNTSNDKELSSKFSSTGITAMSGPSGISKRAITITATTLEEEEDAVKTAKDLSPIDEDEDDDDDDDEIMPQFEHKRSRTITSIETESRKQMELALEQKPHASEGDESPIHTKKKKNGINRLNITPKSIARPFKSISPKSGAFKFNVPFPRSGTFPRQATFVEHESIGSVENSVNDDDDDDGSDDDHDMNEIQLSVIKHPTVSADNYTSDDADSDNENGHGDMWNESKLIVIGEDTEIPQKQPVVIKVDKVDDHENENGKHDLRRKSTESEMNTILKDVLSDINDAIDEEKEKEGDKDKDKEIAKDSSIHSVNTQNTFNLLSPLSINSMNSKRSSGIHSIGLVSGITKHFPRLSGLWNKDESDLSTNSMHSTISQQVSFHEEIDVEEKKQMEMAEKVCLNDFVAVSCKAVHTVLYLCYQSIARFKQTNEWILFQQDVNLSHLLDQYGDNGCIPKQINVIDVNDIKQQIRS